MSASLDRFGESDEFRVHFDARVVNIGLLGQESLLVSLVSLNHYLLLVVVEREQLTLLLGRDALVSVDSLCDLVGKNGH